MNREPREALLKMAGSREIRRRIRSVQNIGQITHAMELVAASKMRRAQEVAIAGRRYTYTMYAMLGNLLGKIDSRQHPLLREMEEPTGGTKTLMIVFGPDKGLCGGLVTNLLRDIARFKQDHPSTEFVTMGRKTRDGVVRLGGTLLADFELRDRPKLGDVVPLTKLIMKEFLTGHYQEVIIANTRFVSTLQQKPRLHRLLPLSSQLVEHSTSLLVEPNVQVSQEVDFVYEPGVEAVLQQLLPRFIEMTVFQSLLEAQASEHSARMIAMKNAGDHARELRDDLILTFNQLRQASITVEVAEIAAGAG